MRILYIFPHPDDESFGPARAMAAQRRQGHGVYLLTLTRGEATKVRHTFGWTLDQMGDVLETSRGEIVHGGDRRAVGEEMFREMAPDESRASRDQDPHGPGETHRGFVSVSVSVPAAIPVPIRVHRFLSFHIGSV